MRVLIAPDAFKGSLSAAEAAEAMRMGVERALPDAEIDVCPLADGGEGTATIFVSACGGVLRSAMVTGPRGTQVRARWGLLGDGTAVVEAAEAAGLSLSPPPRDPMRTTTYGVGELIREALDADATSIIVALGGTATSDGGAGMAQALGVEFAGSPTPAVGGSLRDIRRVSSAVDPRLLEVDVIAATDVDNPLTGANGAAAVFAPQKGATPEQVAALEAGLVHYAAVLGDPGNEPGDGAAGGLGYALRVFARARRVSGAELLLDAVDFDARCVGSDLVLTGEGRLDGQTLRGKVVATVAARGSRLGIPVVALAGTSEPAAAALLERGLTAYYALTDEAPPSDARSRAATLLEDLTARVVAEHTPR